LKLSQFAFLADENIHPEVVTFLRLRALDVVSASAMGLAGTADTEILRVAFEAARVVLTHDSDCGTLAMAGGQPIHGIVYLRPGHIEAQFTIASLKAILSAELDLTTPFLLVAVRRGHVVTIRVRHL